MILLLSILLARAGEPREDKRLPFTEEREALTVEYLQAHRTTALSGDPARDTRMEPRVVVLHWTAGPTMASAWNTFRPARLAGRPELQGAGALNVGAHFLVDRDGTVYRLFDEDRVLRHVIGLNHLAIGIENVGGGEQWPLTAAQVAANIELVRALTARHGITHLLGHHEVACLEGHPYFEEKDPKYRTRKPDPGPAFMAAVRAGLGEAAPEGCPASAP